MTDIPISQQIFESLNRARRILIPLPQNPSGDNLAASLALYDFLKKLDKEPHLVSLGSPAERYRFLPGAEAIRNTIEQSRGFVISVRTDNAPLAELTYHQDDQAGLVNIFLKAQEGHYEPGDVSFKADKFPYDLVVVLGLSSLDLLGKLYDDNTDLFFETPIINIDHHANNEHFGEINLVDITATAATEILMELLENFEAGLIDANIATNLLTGILTETNSFQHIKTTPKAFLKASSLISLGADQQEIIRNLYKTKSVGMLKLWGRALARLHEVPELGLAYTLIKAEDQEKTGSSDLLEVMEEMTEILSDAKIVILLAEAVPSRVIGYVYIHPSFSNLEVSNLLAAEAVSERLKKFVFEGKTLPEAEVEVLSRLSKLRTNIVTM